MAKSQIRSVFSPCQHWLPIVLAGLLLAGLCLSQVPAGDANQTGLDRLAEVQDPNTGPAGESDSNTAPVMSETMDFQGQAPDDSNTVPAPSSGVSEGVARQNKLHEVWDKIRSLSLWQEPRTVAFFIAIGVAVVGIIAWFFLSKTLRTRRRMHRDLTQDSDIDDFLIIFNWTEKVLYFPSIIVSLLAAAAMYMNQAGLWSLEPMVVGRIWFPIVFLNFLIEEYNIRLRGIIATVVGIAFLLLWLYLASYLRGFLRLFTHITILINGTGFLLIGLIGFAAIVVSWIKGLFYYATITPNYMDLQEGPSESGEQISREDYNTRLDTSNFLERLLGFGKIEITFKHGSRHPLRYLVWGIGKKAQKLEKVRAKFVIDHKQGRRMMGSDSMSPDKV
jgi:hypothetical protein